MQELPEQDEQRWYRSPVKIASVAVLIVISISVLALMYIFLDIKPITIIGNP